MAEDKANDRRSKLMQIAARHLQGPLKWQFARRDPITREQIWQLIEGRQTVPGATSDKTDREFEQAVSHFPHTRRVQMC